MDATANSIPPVYTDHWMTQDKSWKQFAFISQMKRFEELPEIISPMDFRIIDERLAFYLKSHQEKYKQALSLFALQKSIRS